MVSTMTYPLDGCLKTGSRYNEATAWAIFSPALDFETWDVCRLQMRAGQSSRQWRGGSASAARNPSQGDVHDTADAVDVQPAQRFAVNGVPLAEVGR